jgi:hypothetical protein
LNATAAGSAIAVVLLISGWLVVALGGWANGNHEE